MLFFTFLATLVLCLHQGQGLEIDYGNRSVPIVLWHGMGDSCCNPLSLGAFKETLEKHIPGVYVHSLRIGDNFAQDTENGFFMNVNDQVAMACQKIGQDPKLSNGYNAIGFSQGSQFLRAVAQRCPQGMRNLISFGGQHQGVYGGCDILQIRFFLHVINPLIISGIPSCFGEDHTICDYVRRLLNYGAYKSWIQDYLVQAQYWHDPLDEATYKAKSLFIAEINNERPVKNWTYAENMKKLSNFVMVKFTEDSMVDPIASEWFEFYQPGQADQIQPLEQTKLYQEDWLGLKALKESGRLHFLISRGNHLQFTEHFLVEKIVKPFLL